MSHLRRWLPVVVCLAGVALAAPPVAPLRPTDAAPVLDGQLDDKCWERAGVSTLPLTAEGQRAMQATRWLALRDERALYFALKAFDEPAALRAPRALVTQHDGDGLRDDDGFELVLDTAQRGACYRLAANVAGVTWDAWDDGRAPHLDWEPAVELAVRWAAKCWVAELALPWDSLDRDDWCALRWRLHVVRTRARTREKLVWAPAPGGWLDLIGGESRPLGVPLAGLSPAHGR